MAVRRLGNQEPAESTAAKKVLYVAPTGKDTNAGSIKQPLKTLKRASQLAKAGTTVYLRKGTYHGSVDGQVQRDETSTGRLQELSKGESGLKWEDAEAERWGHGTRPD